jgi:hypothetical protein
MHFNSNLLPLGYNSAANGPFPWQEPELQDHFPTTDFSTASPISKEALQEEAIPSGILSDGSSGMQRLHATGLSPYSAPFPQQILTSPAVMNNVGFHDASVISFTPVMQPHGFPNMISNGTTFYPPMTAPAAQRTLCTQCTETFARSSDLDRHWRSVHLGIKYHCFWPGCPNNRGKGYCRLEKLRTHQREKHGFA